MAKIVLAEEKFIVHEGKFDLMFTVDHITPNISICTSEGDDEFVFDTKLNKQTLQRWEKVCKLILKGIKLVKEKEYGKEKR